jgi:NAD(P)-dependent dehydrogenase (short-subunit alcohol dehydrogenase family)
VSPFGPASTAEEVTAGLDLSGRVAVVTGATSGLGLETLRVLAMRGAHVIATGRTRERAAEACVEAGAAGRSTPVGLDLEDWPGIVAAADEIRALGRPIDMLVCNAGIMHPAELRLVNGFEQQFAINHLGHFILCNRLIDLVRASPQGRVVVVSSQLLNSAPPGGIDFDNLDGSRGFDTNRMYGQSKLANALFAIELARREAGTAVTANTLHPGVALTNLDRARPAWRRALSRLLAFRHDYVKSIPAAAATQVYLATHPVLATTSGYYFEDCNPVISPSPYLADADLAAELWRRSEVFTAAYLG